MLSGEVAASGVMQRRSGNGSFVRWLALCLTGGLGIAMVTGTPTSAENYPSPAGTVVDDGHALTTATRNALKAELDRDNQSATAQLAVVTVQRRTR